MSDLNKVYIFDLLFHSRRPAPLMLSAGPVSFVTALGEFVSRAAGGESAALVTGCAALETDASTVQTRDYVFTSLFSIACTKINFSHIVFLSQVCVNLLIQKF